ncbi:MAG: iron(III) transport system substrate-binding protein [Oceanicoccus sp.]|jgi:iron(III) transport system substrate-binding protein
MKNMPRFGLLPLLAFLISCGQQAPEATTEQLATKAELMVYSARKEHLIKPLFDLFTEQTGIIVNYITDKEGPLLARLEAEGDNSPADMLITVDAGNLWQASQLGVLQPLQSALLEANVPSHLQDADNQWFALTIRARTMVYASDRLSPDAMSSYEQLADKAWRGKLCLRTSKKVYNQSLVASMMASLGEAQTEQVISGWVANLALDPFSNDTKVMEAISVGQCDVGIVNSYYYGRLMKTNPELALALFWPNQEGEGGAGRGVHINVSGAGVTKASKHKAQAQQLLEWLSGAQAQQILMGLNQEYPVNPTVVLNEELAAWGEFKGDMISVSEAGRLQAKAVKLMDRAGYR